MEEPQELVQGGAHRDRMWVALELAGGPPACLLRYGGSVRDTSCLEELPIGDTSLEGGQRLLLIFKNFE